MSRPRRVSIEAGRTRGWEHYIGREGIAIGIDTFGASAPAGKLFAHFGINAEAVVTEVLCGVTSAWDAYLRAELDVYPRADGRIGKALESLFPRVPYQHPINDWW